jgi:hypothetical protein
LKEDEIDITPWLPLLCDGNPHTFTLKVVGLNNYANGTADTSQSVGNYWLVSGKIFIWLDEEGHVTSGTIPVVNGTALSAQVSSTGTSVSGNSAKLYYQVDVNRNLEVSSIVQTSTGAQPAFWRQDLQFSNLGNYTEAGKIETTQQQITGMDGSSSGYDRKFSYPLYASTGYSSNSRGIIISATINREKNLQTAGHSIFGNCIDTATNYLHDRNIRNVELKTYQNASGTMFRDGRRRTITTSVELEQNLSIAGLPPTNHSSIVFPSAIGFVPALDLHIRAVDGSIVPDNRMFTALSEPKAYRVRSPPSIRLPGRGRRGRVLLDSYI